MLSGRTRLSTRNLQNSLYPIWACMQLQHCEAGTTCGGAGRNGHLRPVASDSAHLDVIDAVRAWPQACVVAWVVWHISLDERRLLGLDYWREVRQSSASNAESLLGNHSLSVRIGRQAGLWLSSDPETTTANITSQRPEILFLWVRNAGREARKSVETA